MWMNHFQQSTDRQVIDGEIDLRDSSIDPQDVVLLDGEWEFYPNEWLITTDHNDQSDTTYINVPDGWDERLFNHEQDSYGYGTYRMKVFVDPDVQSNYSLFFPSIRSASEIYVNEKLLSSAGKIGTSMETTHPRNVPQHVTFAADDTGTIEIIVQVTNFHDIRRSGLIRSVKFGTEMAMTHERKLSLAMQVLTLGTFLLHALYAIVLFFLGNREKRLLYFALLLFCITLVNAMIMDEKIIHLITDLPYEWDFRVANSLTVLAIYGLLKSFDEVRIPYRRAFYSILSISILSLAFIIIFLTPAQILALSPLIYLFGGLALIITVIAIIQKLLDNVAVNLLLLLSFLAAANHFMWYLYWREIGISVVHYPIDLIIAIGCFSAVWFKDYFTVHAETKKLANKLELMNKHKDQFLAQTSHEFKNPLHGIINLSQAVLHREKSLTNESNHELQMIRSVGRRLSLLLNDLLDEASLRDGKHRLNKEPFKLQTIVAGIFDLLKFMVEMKPIKLINDIPDDFPAVYGDENRIIQVLYNLMHNAVKYTDQGRIIIDAQINNNRAIINIRDTGHGIDAANIEQILLPYKQSNHVITEGGYGLGLSISKQLIEQHKSQLTIKSVVGKGSTFSFSLPLASEEDMEQTLQQLTTFNPFTSDQKHNLNSEFFTMAEQQMAAATEPQTYVDPGHKSFHILVVDDDPINLNVMKSILSADIFAVTTVTSGQEALAILDDQPWSLVIADIMMPHMSGFELTKKIRERFTFTDLPILLLTARSDPKDIRAGFAAGANDYVTKPVEYLELTSRVNALIAIKNAVYEQVRLKSAWLQAQIQPHFLFNTLNSIIALSTVDTKQMNDLLIELSNYLRSKFQYYDIEQLIPIKDELKLVKSYVNIEQVRFGERLEVHWDIPENLQVEIPFLTIQPLVENAIRHGLMKNVSGGKLTIKIREDQSSVTVSVIDNGVGMSEEKRAKLLERDPSEGASIGLINTNQRLMQHFGTGLHIDSTLGEGTVVSFTVPQD